jgi:hypothetical protein
MDARPVLRVPAVRRRLDVIRLAALLALAAVAGCGSQSDETPATKREPTPAASRPTAYPAAYRLGTAAARSLAGRNAMRVIAREGRVVARSQWDAYSAIVLSEWLGEHGVRLETPRGLRPVLRELASEQELPLLVVAREHRRYARTMARLDPTGRELRSFYEQYTHEESADAGRAMLDWLRILRTAIGRADARHVVLIPVQP